MVRPLAVLSRFVPSPTSKSSEWVDDLALVEDVRCLLRIGTRDLIVGTKADAALTVCDLDRSKLSQRVQAQLAFHEVASGRVLALDVQELYVFDLQVLELLMDAPGLNDAMYLYGAMRGPYPASAGAAVTTVEGQLTVTRSDLLGALVEGVADAFAYRPEASGARCVHALLPGERDAMIDGGRGVVLALPLAPAWTLESMLPNDKVAAQIICDVIGALRRDLGDPTPLPVPNRSLVVADLQAQGFAIEGDEAVRTKKGGLLGMRTERETKPLPREASLDEFVALATQALPVIGQPSPEALALRRRRAGRPTVAMRVTPAPAVPVAQPSTPVSTPRPRVATGSSAWVKDFIDAHQAQGHAKPKVVAPARFVAPPAPPTNATPDWMDDFADPEPAKEAGPKSDTDKPSSGKPDWSKDFE